MKRRTLQTIKLLAVGVAAAGCTRAVGPEAGVEVVRPDPPATAQPAPVQAQASPVQAPEAERPIPPLPPAPEGGKLVELSAQLDQAGPEGALQQVDHFRPLCDKDGYPLVGNVMGKGQRGQPYTAKKFCAEVRRQAKR